jgi:hypothetical protein
MAKLIQVIENMRSVGSGNDNDPHRGVMEYFTPDGEKVASVDSWAHMAAKDIWQNASAEVVEVPLRVLRALFM